MAALLFAAVFIGDYIAYRTASTAEARVTKIWPKAAGYRTYWVHFETDEGDTCDASFRAPAGRYSVDDHVLIRYNGPVASCTNVYEANSFPGTSLVPVAVLAVLAFTAWRYPEALRKFARWPKHRAP
jgi:hypothetical protein